VLRSVRKARVFSTALFAGAVLAAGTLLATGSPAIAGPSLVAIQHGTWGYLDSRTPNVGYLNPASDAPVGTLRDARGDDHKYRSFFTFDVSRFRGTTITSVTLSTSETQAPDCEHRRVELWTTGPFDATSTWRRPPAELAKISTLTFTEGNPCLHSYVAWDATAALRQAAAAGQSTLTLELRIPRANEGDARLGRRFDSNVSLSVTYNTPPNVPTALSINSLGCVTQAPYPWLNSVNGASATLYAKVTDPDPTDMISTEFAVWPVDHPDQRTVLPAGASVSGQSIPRRLPDGMLADATTYAFQAREQDDGGLYSAWSDACYFRTDFTAPAAAPSVSSTDYPSGTRSGGVGIKGTFTFSAGGDPDVVGFSYDFPSIQADHGYVAADRPGGSATALIAPPSVFSHLEVEAVDRAGNMSPATLYSISAGDTTPLVSAVGTPHVGRPFTVSFAPGLQLPSGYDHVVSYTYTLGTGPSQTAPAAADGTASVSIVLTENHSYTLQVTSTSGNGWGSPARSVSYTPDDSPSVSSDVYPESGTGGGVGQPGTFTLAANLPGSTQFLYSWDFGATFAAVPVQADGTATITYTPDTPGDTWLVVYSQTADGGQSAWYLYDFTVAG
jgi:hypothetical protein